MKDAVATMGGILPDDAGGRDAVHVAVFAAISGAQVFPSQHVGVVAPEPANEHGDIAVTGTGVAPVGIVDPFLSAPVPAGSRFWVYLYPRTITALAHRWSHPVFEETATAYATPSSKVSSEQWLRDFVARSDCPSYEEVLGKAAAFVISGDSGSEWSDDEYLHFDGRDAHGEIPPEFWDHVGIVIGRPLPQKRPAYFSCSC